MDNIFSNFILIVLLFHGRGAEADSCYSTNGIARACEPPIENLALRRPISVDSSCGGRGPENVCTRWSDQSGHVRDVCEVCDQGRDSQRHSAELINDNHVRGEETCWLSAAVPVRGEMANVNVTIDLQKRALISYVTVELCGDTPDGIVVLKKSYEDEAWTPWQYFSDNCVKMFGIEETSDTIAYLDRMKPICVNLASKMEYGKEGQPHRLLPFNPTLGRRFENTLTNEEQEWLTASSVRFSYVTLTQRSVDNYLVTSKEKESRYVGASNIVIGGRPLCNGHSDRVTAGDDGAVQCDCQHSTAGDDCQRCGDKFNDQPWSPALFGKVATCKRCECNNHADKCTFDIAVYMKTNRKHGSNCISCQDNTAGPQCDRCTLGFYRDYKYPIYHKKACTACQCHSIGSITDRPCDPTTGKCFCKLGVIGPSCNQCGHGFRQTSSRDIPCKRVAFRSILKSENKKCLFCKKMPKKVNLKKYCRKELSLKVSVKSQENRGDWIRFELSVEDMWLHRHTNRKIILDDDQSVKLWLRKELLDCKCLTLKFDRSYVIMTNIQTKSFMGNEELMISQNSVVEEWQQDWKETFVKFDEYESQGRCIQFNRRKMRNTRKRRLTSTMDQYAYFAQ